MRVYLGCDHAGFELKAHLVDWLVERGDTPVDCGPVRYDAQDDYPVYVLRAARRVAAEPGGLGVVIGGSGNGEAIAANKVAGVRAAIAWDDRTAVLAREHNDANVLSLGARMYPIEVATRFVELFLTTPFSGDPRHARRIGMLAEYERSAALPPLPAGPTSA